MLEIVAHGVDHAVERVHGDVLPRIATTGQDERACVLRCVREDTRELLPRSLPCIQNSNELRRARLNRVQRVLEDSELTLDDWRW